MKIDTLLKKLLTQKKEVAEASKVSARSIDFWEKRAEKLFTKMDEAEEDFAFSSDEYIEDTCSQYHKEIDFLMNRMKFENDQLDLLEEQIDKLETELCLAFTQYAKKQKK